MNPSKIHPDIFRAGARWKLLPFGSQITVGTQPTVIIAVPGFHFKNIPSPSRHNRPGPRIYLVTRVDPAIGCVAILNAGVEGDDVRTSVAPVDSAVAFCVVRPNRLSNESRGDSEQCSHSARRETRLGLFGVYPSVYSGSL